jgi:hypothetical protein
VSGLFYQLATLTPTTPEKMAKLIPKLSSLSTDNQQTPYLHLESKFSYPVCGHHISDSYVQYLTHGTIWSNTENKPYIKKFKCESILENIHLEDEKGENRSTLRWISEAQVVRIESG